LPAPPPDLAGPLRDVGQNVPASCRRKLAAPQAATKVAGARCTAPASKDAKAKGKQVANSRGLKRQRATETDSRGPAKKAKGRANGSANYTEEDLHAMLDALEEKLPLGGIVWEEVAVIFNLWAEENERPGRNADSLKRKFEAVSQYTHSRIIVELILISLSSSSACASPLGLESAQVI
jgi:hypothetical protein